MHILRYLFFFTGYTYNSLNQLVGIKDANGTINHIMDKDDLIYWFEYDDNMKDRLVKINTDWQSNYIKNTMEYTNGYLTKVSSNGNNFVFAYDKLGRISSIKIGSSELVNKTYVDNAEASVITNYANGETVSVYSDIFGNPVRCVRDENDILFTADYLVNSAINYVVDNKEKIKYNHIYNEDGYVVKVQRINTENDSLICEDIFEYENDGRTKSTVYGSTGHKLVPVYEKMLRTRCIQVII